MLYSCLRTGDDKTAHFCLERLTERFGVDDERIMGLRGLYQEAMAENTSALMEVLHEYDEILAENPTNTPVRKRRIALLRSLSREGDAANALVELLATSPTDIESWAELADLYISQGLYQQAEFCLEEILLTTPNAWNIHARLGEILFISAAISHNQIGLLAEAVRRFCRSVELCDGYIRGYYGLKMVSEKLVALITKSSQSVIDASTDDSSHDLPVPRIADLQRLSEKAALVLAEAARSSSCREGLHGSNSTFVTDILKSSTMDRQR